MQKLVRFLTLGIIIALLLPNIAFASVVDSNTNTVDDVLSDQSTEQASTQSSTDIDYTEEDAEVKNINIDEPVLFDVNKVLPKVTMDDATAKVQSKGGEILKLVQTVAFYAIAIIGVVGLILMAVGAISKRGDISGIGVGALIICVVAYVLVYCGPYILEWFRAWAVS